MDEEVEFVFINKIQLSIAMEKMQKNPEKWMSRLESQMNDSSEEEREK